jgi:DNA-binding NtrC family response regulator
MDEVERRHIMQALAHYEGNKSKTAASLGITVKTLYNKLERYGRKTTSPTGGQIFRERVPTGTFER